MTTSSRSLDDHNVLGEITIRAFNNNNTNLGLARLNTNFSQDYNGSTSGSRTNSCENSPNTTNTPANPFPSPRKNSCGISPTSLLQKPNSRKNSSSSENPRINSETKINGIFHPKNSQGTFPNYVDNKENMSGFSSAVRSELDNVLEDNQVVPANPSCLQKENKVIVQHYKTGSSSEDEKEIKLVVVLYYKGGTPPAQNYILDSIAFYDRSKYILVEGLETPQIFLFKKENLINVLISAVNAFKDDLSILDNQLVLNKKPKHCYSVGVEETM